MSELIRFFGEVESKKPRDCRRVALCLLPKRWRLTLICTILFASIAHMPRVVADVVQALPAANRSKVSSAAEPTISVQIPKPTQYLLRQDLAQMRSLEGSGGTPLFKQYFGDRYDGGVIMRFLNSRIQSFNYDSCDDSDGTAACVIPSLSHSILFLSIGYDNQLSSLRRISTLLHEARHTDDKFHFHVRCPVPFRDENGQEVTSRITRGPMEGKFACDSSAEGAYGLQIVFLGNTALYCSSCTEDTRKEARQLARELLVRITNIREAAKLREDLQLN